MFIKRNNDKIHRTYDIVEIYFQRNGFDIDNNCKFIVSSKYFMGLSIFIAQLLSHALVFLAHKNKTLVTEFNDYIVCFLSFFFRLDNFYFINNHNIQYANKNYIRRLITKYLYKKINIVLLDFDHIELQLNFKSVTRIPFYCNFSFIDKNVKNKIGLLLSKNRLEKSVNIIYEKFKDDKRFLFGIDDNIEHESFINTKKYSDYLSFIDSIDILIINYKSNDYFLRTSGVISDAISRGVLIICPNYPIFCNQTNIPDKMGFYFNCVSEIDKIIDQAYEFRSSDMYKIAYFNHSKYRSLF